MEKEKKSYEQKTLAQIRHFLEEQDYARTLELISKLSFLRPDEWRYYERSAEIYLTIGDISSAIMFYRKAYSINKTSDIARRLAALLDGWGVLQFMEEDYERANSLFAEATALAKDVAVFWYHWSVLVRKTRGDKEALAYIDQAIKLEPESPLLLASKAEMFNKLGEDCSAYALVKQAISRDRFFAKALKLRAEYDERLHRLEARATAALLAGRFEEALKACAEGLVIVPNHISFLSRRGSTLARMGLFDDAKDVLSDAHRIAMERANIKETPEEADEMPVENLGAPDAGARSGDRSIAVKVSAKRPQEPDAGLTVNALSLPPELSLPRSESTGQPDTARSYTNSVKGGEKSSLDASRIRTLLAHVYNESGIRFFQMGNINAAIKEMNEAIRLDPAPLQFYVNRGDCHRAKGDIRLALGNYHVVLRRDPDNPHARSRIAIGHHTLGTDFFNQRAWEEAEAEFSLAMKYNPTVPRFYIDRARTALNLEHIDIAFADLRRCLELDNTNDLAKTLFAKMCPNGRIPPDVHRQIFGTSGIASAVKGGGARRRSNDAAPVRPRGLPLHETMKAFRPTPEPSA